MGRVRALSVLAQRAGESAQTLPHFFEVMKKGIDQIERYLWLR
jgi:hypothetical protein